METQQLTDAQWERLHPLLPPQKPRTGRPAQDHRTILTGILWILRTGVLRRCLPECYGSWKSIASRFYRSRRPCHLRLPTWDQVSLASAVQGVRLRERRTGRVA